ncbi:serine/threonine protein kinase [Myxococcus sp. CA056]|uniref:serine/threonine-protein kinase n=1 Tax=Myxococcus sp. CA056 TaxID=2741740 RepID=UPI00157B16C2|nr:serine/threonine-protein kinase [Myxococcus sp. CA056]NTX15468.1 serine/threonine protein kinase [Myxococcus sp. CA056]
MRNGPSLAVLAPGSQVVGYTVERRLGSGGFGAVYLARCDGQSAALKLLDVARVGERVQREVSILLKLNHPNVVGILGFGRWPTASPEFAVIVMEYVEGRQLDAWASEENPSARQVARVVLDVARALEAAHGADVLHRDVKEANVMVRASDGAAKLVDFGVGDFEGARGITSDILPPGTPEYRSPEAWTYFRQNVRVPGASYAPTPSDDLWALGVVLYKLLTARVPFEGPDDYIRTEAVISAAPMSPRAVNERVPVALSDLCMRLLEKTPATRVPSAQALRVALEEALRDADAAWDLPLCDSYGEDSATTEGDRDSHDRWLLAPLHRPRRGKRPHVAREEPLPACEVRAPEEKAPTTEHVSWPVRPAWTWAAVALAMVLVAVGALWSWRTSRVAGAVPTRQEVARIGSSSQAVQAAAPPIGTEATPAVVAVPAMLPEATTVKMEKTEIPTPPKPAKKGTGIMSRVVAAAVTCSALGCPGTQVRPPPPPESCPAGAVEAMEKWGVEVGDHHDAKLPVKGGGAAVVTVREGPAEVTLLGNWERIPSGTVFSGRLSVSDRLYGRFTRARTRGGDSFPVCLELRTASLEKGLELESVNADSASVRVFSSGDVKAVAEFE